MFTGIIETTAVVENIESRGGDVRLTVIEANSSAIAWAEVALGDSIATNGVCLTVVEKFDNGFSADVSTETLANTTVGSWQKGQRVNLEQALQPTSRMGGHMVSGHVDGVGEILSLHEDARAWRYSVAAPKQLAKYIAKKGSITVDGTSLTVNEIDENTFTLAIVPHTMQETVFASYKPGVKVNLEVDLIARYLERLLLGDSTDEPSNRDDSHALDRHDAQLSATLRDKGFIKGTSES